MEEIYYNNSRYYLFDTTWPLAFQYYNTIKQRSSFQGYFLEMLHFGELFKSALLQFKYYV